ncbi:MAG TPA: hypothetical protein PKA13_05380 [Geminicoccaceae bacterium]|nr:hypothetical protein [Geminicoccus sp.]HMU49185.1 hypothetical protein [Geminicoccaceae bacterium]
MGLYQLAAFAHLVGAVLLIGYLLLWAIMGLALSRRFAPDEVRRYLGVVAAARWPHVIVPWRLRLPWPLVGWAMLAFMILSGALLLAIGPVGLDGVMWAKLVVVLLLVGLHHLYARRASPPVGYAGLALGLVVVALSAHLLR